MLLIIQFNQDYIVCALLQVVGLQASEVDLSSGWICSECSDKTNQARASSTFMLSYQLNNQPVPSKGTNTAKLLGQTRPSDLVRRNCSLFNSHHKTGGARQIERIRCKMLKQTCKSS